MNTDSRILFENYGKVRGKCYGPSNLAGYEAERKMHYEKCIKKYLQNNKKAKILEIGCCSGAELKAIYNDGFHNLTGIDMDVGAIEIARKRCPDVRFFVGDGIDFLKGTDEKFDFIFSIAVFEHIEKKNVIKMIEEIKNHLTPNGGILIDVPNMQWIYASYERYMDFTHENGFTEDLLIEVLKVHFEIVKINYGDLAKNHSVKQRLSRYFLWKLYSESGIPATQEQLFSREVIAYACKKRDVYL